MPRSVSVDRPAPEWLIDEAFEERLVGVVEAIFAELVMDLLR